MAYLDAYLQPCPGYGWSGGPEFKTRIVEMANGVERRNADWAQPRHRYTSPFLNISKDAYRQIKQMHLVCRGQLHAFRFRDELDYEAEEEFFGLGDGSQDTFQLSKFSQIDGVIYQRSVFAIFGDPVITLNGVVTSQYLINKDTGEIVFNSPPSIGDMLNWTGVFDIWVRFAQDWLPFSIDNIDATNGSVDLIEVSPPYEVTS